MRRTTPSSPTTSVRYVISHLFVFPTLYGRGLWNLLLAIDAPPFLRNGAMISRVLKLVSLFQDSVRFLARNPHAATEPDRLDLSGLHSPKDGDVGLTDHRSKIPHADVQTLYLVIHFLPSVRIAASALEAATRIPSSSIPTVPPAINAATNSIMSFIPSPSARRLPSPEYCWPCSNLCLLELPSSLRMMPTPASA